MPDAPAAPAPNTAPDPQDRDPLYRLPDAMVLALIAVYCGIELVLQGADHRLWGSVLWRPLAYQYGGFWAGLMRGGWLANYPGQTGAMFVTHSFLHAGFSHLIGNMITLAALANLLCRPAGTGRVCGPVAAVRRGRGLCLRPPGPRLAAHGRHLGRALRPGRAAGGP